MPYMSTPPVTDPQALHERETALRTACPFCASTAPTWGQCDAPQDWGGMCGFGPRYHCTNCDEYRVINSDPDVTLE